MRIISGKFKGHHLVSFQADHIRPTTDKVKETLFNKIQFDIPEAKVLDLFCGTGNLGLEAYSRGASYVHFVDKNHKSLEIVNKNLEKLKINKSEIKTSKVDIFTFIKNFSDQNFDVIFIDPPFTEKMAHEVMTQLSSSKLFHENTIITIESIKQERIDDAYGELFRYDHKDFGDKVLSFFKKQI